MRLMDDLFSRWEALKIMQMSFDIMGQIMPPLKPNNTRITKRFIFELRNLVLAIYNNKIKKHETEKISDKIIRLLIMYRLGILRKNKEGAFEVFDFIQGRYVLVFRIECNFSLN